MRAGLDEGRLVSAYLSHIIDVELLAPLDDQLIVNLGLGPTSLLTQVDDDIARRNFVLNPDLG